jgi:hypothetical protein
MTGREHYGEAERLLEIADEVGARVGPDAMQAYAAQAQAHATLALASTQSAIYYGHSQAFGQPTSGVGVTEDGPGEVA